MEKQDLFTIGEFSNITGVGIHSLRYYDEIGALKPEYVDPVSNYRYYGFDQLKRIPGINICIDSGIRLSDFSRFIDDDDINYDKLLCESRNAIDRKIEEYRKQEQELRKIEQLLEISKSVTVDDIMRVNFSGCDLWTISYSGNNITANESDILIKISNHARKHGCQISPIFFGLISTVTNRDPDDRRRHSYAFALIGSVTDKGKAAPYIKHLEEGEYDIIRCSSSSLDKFEEISMKGSDRSTVLSFMLIGDSPGESKYFTAASVC